MPEIVQIRHRDAATPGYTAVGLAVGCLLFVRSSFCSCFCYTLVLRCCVLDMLILTGTFSGIVKKRCGDYVCGAAIQPRSCRKGAIMTPQSTLNLLGAP